MTSYHTCLLPLLLLVGLLHSNGLRVSNPDQPANSSASSLEDLMYKYKTDKSKDDHKYVDLYKMLFEPIRGQVQNLLEVGVASGQSLQVWNDYFTNANIYGMDLFPPHLYDIAKVQKTLESMPRIKLFKKSSQSRADVDSIGFEHGTIDIVIDDGAHDLQGQEKTLEAMWDIVKPGGYYIIEDVEWDQQGDRKAYPFLHEPERLQNTTNEILQNNDAFFADTSVGHRAWDTWVNRLSNWVPDLKPAGEKSIDRFSHNTHLLVIRKRSEPMHEVQVNLGSGAMRF